MRETKADKIFNAFDYTIAIIALIIIMYPLWFVVIASISNPALVSSGQIGLLPKGINFEGYKMILKHEDLWIGYGNTIFYTFFHVLISIAITTMGGYSLSRKDLPMKKGLLLYFVVTMYFGGGLIPTYLWMKSIGLVNTRFVIILLGAVSTYNIIITRTYFMSNLPDEIYEAASIDGCGDYRFFAKIAFPLAKPLVAVLVVFAAVGKWNDYFNGLVYLIDSDKFPLQLILREILVQGQTQDLMSLGAMEDKETFMNTQETMKYGVIIVSSLPVMILYPFVQKYFTKGIMLGAVKG